MMGATASLHRLGCHVGLRSLSSKGWLHCAGLHPSNITVAPSPFYRWINLPAAFATHLSLGSIYAWSILNEPLTRLDGVVAPAAHDWALGDISVTFSLVMGGFAWGAVLGKYFGPLGPRTTSLLGSASLFTGFGLGSLAVAMHSLPMLYLAGGVWGLANGWSYVPPVATLLQWFPDRKGFASGACIVGFGGGAILAAPLFTALLHHFRRLPEYLGPSSAVDLVQEGGKLLAQVGADMKEVVVATGGEAAAYGAQEGVYLVGTGSTGAAETLLVMGSVYAAVTCASALAFRLPQRSTHQDTSIVQERNVDEATALKSTTFWTMWLGFGCSLAGGYGLIAIGKTLLTDVFQTVSPEIVTAAFATSFVAAMSVANLGGRVLWSNLSDVFASRHSDPLPGRRWTHTLMWGMSPALYMSILWSIHQLSPDNVLVPLTIFSASLFGILANFGGTAATRPALVSDVFGMKHVGSLTAKQLSVILPSAYLGPQLASYLREQRIQEAMHNLASQVPDTTFMYAFGSTKADLQHLIDANIVTINRLLELLPSTVQNPLPYVYDDTLYAMAALQCIALISNMAVRPLPDQPQS